MNSHECRAKRLQRTIRLKGNPKAQRIELARCAKDIRYFVREWVWTYDPRLKIPAIPFLLFPKQEDFLLWLLEREETQTSGLAEKSRDMGFTWLCCTYLAWRWLFSPGFKGAVGSRKFDLVDKIGDPDCIFEKIRFILQRLPAWLVPAGYQKHSGLGKLVNPFNGATITGEGGDQIGRGGRSSIYFVDESAFIEHPKLVDAALSANTNVRIDVSTPNGNGNPFAQKRFSGNVAVFTMHWKEDPRKNRWQVVDKSGHVVMEGKPGELAPDILPADCLLVYPWYVAQKRVLDEVTIAQEIDIDYTASLEGIAIPAKWVQAAVDLYKRVNLPRHGQIIAAMDVADGGNNKSILGARQGPVVFMVRERLAGNTIDTANWAIDQCRDAHAHFLNYDSVGVGSGVTALFQVRARENKLPLLTRGVNVGESPTDARWPDGKTAKEKFMNLKAELWETVRERFKKTYEFTQGSVFSLDELIAIPDDAELKAQLSNVLRFKTETGKIQIEKKDELRRRGVASPDKAEMLMLLFAETAKPVQMAVGEKRKAINQYQVR